MTIRQSLSAWIRSHRAVTAVAGLAVAALAVYLALGVFGVHTLVIDEVVEEADPFTAATSPAPASDADPTTTPTEPTAGEPAADREGDAEAGTAASTEPTADPEREQPTAADAPAEPTVLLAGEFQSRSHPTSGEARIVTDGSRRVLRLDDLRTDNGPDLNVYLTSAPPDAGVSEIAADFVDLGDLKGNIGDQNYRIGEDVDLERYDTVVIWCVRFSVAFGTAALA